MLDCSHKTVIVLDHGTLFGSPSGEIILDGKGSADAIPLQKTMWTCAVEAGFEYLRLVGDLLPESKALVRFVISDFVGRNLTPIWSSKTQTLDVVAEKMCGYKSPDSNGDPEACSILNGLSVAVEDLSQTSELQKAALKRKQKGVRNHGRVIVITHIQNENEIEAMESHIMEQIESRNILSSNLDENYMTIQKLELFIINVHPVGSNGFPIRALPLVQIDKSNGIGWKEVRNSLSGHGLVVSMQSLAITHFELRSTTVTSIPMKEEQTQGQSANYDVELLHHKSAHDDLFRLGLLGLAGVDSLMVDGPNGYKTLQLKWCSPNAKSGLNADDFYLSSSASRVTPSAVNSRPSACLTTFILSGRTVMLEVARKGQAPIAGIHASGGKAITHVLTNHGGQIFIHSLPMGRSPIEDPPSITEGPGGKVTDYRITHFADIINECRLGPSTSNESQTAAVNTNTKAIPNKRSRLYLRQITEYFPMVFSESVLSSLLQIPNMLNFLGPLISLSRKSMLNEHDMTVSKEMMFRLISLQANGEALPMTAGKFRGSKHKDEMYRVLFDEITTHLRAYSFQSIEHHSVLNFWLQCIGRKGIVQQLRLEDPLRLKELENVEDEFEKEEIEMEELEEGEVGEVVSVPKKKVKVDNNNGRKAPRVVSFVKGKTLMDAYMEEYSHQWDTWKDFVGRSQAGPGNIAILYQDLLKKDKEAKEAQEVMQE